MIIPRLSLSKPFNQLRICISVSSELDEVGSWLMQLLYDNYDSGKFVSSSSLAGALELDESMVIEGLSHLIEADLVDQDGSGYRLSEKGYSVAYQRASSYCPHL